MENIDMSEVQKLESDLRKNILPPDKIVSLLQLKSSDTVADIGCGSGYFTLELAVAVNEGKVYAIEISQDLLDYVQEKLYKKSIKNAVLKLAGEGKLPLEERSITYGVVMLVLHEVSDKRRFLEEIERVIALEGRVAILEWIKDASRVRTPLEDEIEADSFEERIAAEEVDFEMKTLGFSLMVSHEVSELFYLHIYKKVK